MDIQPQKGQVQEEQAQGVQVQGGQSAYVRVLSPVMKPKHNI